MKKSALLILLCAILSFSLFAAVIPSEVDNSLENILNLTTVENQAVTAPDFGGVIVFSVDLSEQVNISYCPEGYFNIMIVTADPYIGVEMDDIESDNKMLIVTIIDESRGGTALFAEHYKQLLFS